MIVDCHTHIWESPAQLGRAPWWNDAQGRRRWEQGVEGPATLPRAGITEHRIAAKPVDQTFVLGFVSKHLNAEIPNDYIARYVRRHPDRLIGFAGIDPTDPRLAIGELRRARQELGFKGVSLWPSAQNFHPASTSAMQVYGEISRFKMPVVFHQELAGSPVSKMEFARPFLLDEVAREFPQMPIIVSQLGYPWVDETLVLLSKHRNVFADISGLHSYPWRAYNALLSAYQAGVMDRLLFGSNFPFGSPAVCIESLYSINQLCHGTALPTIPREQLRRIVERDTLDILGIEHPHPPAIPEPDTTLIPSDE